MKHHTEIIKTALIYLEHNNIYIFHTLAPVVVDFDIVAAIQESQSQNPAPFMWIVKVVTKYDF